MWLVVSHHTDHYNLWRETHKDLAHHESMFPILSGHIQKLEKEVEDLRERQESMERHMKDVEETLSKMTRLVIKLSKSLAQHDDQLSLLQFLLTALLCHECEQCRRPGSSNDEPQSGPGPGNSPSPPTPCPSLSFTLEPSRVDSPPNSPSSPFRGDLPSPLIQEEGNLLRSALQAIQEGAEIEDGSNRGFSGVGGHLGDLSG